MTETSGKPETNPLWAGDGSALLYQTGASFETISLDGGAVTPVSIAGAADWAVVRPLFFAPAWGGHADADSHLAYVFGGNLFVVPVDLTGDAPVFGEPVQIWSNSDGTDFRAVSPTISNDDSTVVFVVEEYADDLLYGLVDEDESYSFVTNGNLDVRVSIEVQASRTEEQTVRCLPPRLTAPAASRRSGPRGST